MRIEPLPGTQAHGNAYKIDNKRVPGATTITGLMPKELTNWANQLGLEGVDVKEYVRMTQRMGSFAHKLIENHLLELAELPFEKEDKLYTPEEIDRAENSFLSFLEWEKGHRLGDYQVELELISRKYRFGGCIDYIGMLDGKLTLLDLKTSKALYGNHIVQVAGAYRLLLEEHDIHPEQVVILRIGRSEDEGFGEHTIGEETADMATRYFLNLLDQYELRKEAKRLGVYV